MKITKAISCPKCNISENLTFNVSPDKDTSLTMNCGNKVYCYGVSLDISSSGDSCHNFVNVACSRYENKMPAWALKSLAARKSKGENIE
jgi:hypothetical protein